MQGAWLNLCDGEFVEERKIIEVVKNYDINRPYFQEQGRNSFTSDVSVCRTTQRRFRTTNAHCVKGKYNAVWLHNPNQGVITIVQEDENDTRMKVTRHITGLIR